VSGPVTRSDRESQQFNLDAESDYLQTKLVKTAKAVALVEDRRAELLMVAASTARAEQVVDRVTEAGLCRRVADAAFELILAIDDVALRRREVASPSASRIVESAPQPPLAGRPA
jgi:hypothetical protein